MYVNVTGNLTEDPELRYTNSGTPYARLRIAENHQFTNRDGNKVEKTSYHTVVCWRELAENVANSVRKGMRVMVSGRQEDRSFQTESGENRNVKEITADEVGASMRWATADVTRIRGGQGGNQGGNQGGPRQAPPAQPQEARPTTPDASGYDPYNSDEEPF